VGSNRSRTTVFALLAIVLAGPAAAHARVISAETVLPPGQSGFVPPAGQPDNPHLTDQIALFESFAFKPAGFDQPGATETPRAGVTITRDGYGVPSVRAGSERDAWFGAGYAVAQDRLVELELFRRATRGRLAEVLGVGADCVSVKAKSGEGLDAVGEWRAVTVQAVVLLEHT
jgi:acyl-homoserine lactone acylase PvdQ